ncbi:MAG: hypothetical protein WKG07_07920 [Hymenobacter sp.]
MVGSLEGCCIEDRAGRGAGRAGEIEVEIDFAAQQGPGDLLADVQLMGLQEAG